jgi:hypothetical protein
VKRRKRIIRVERQRRRRQNRDYKREYRRRIARGLLRGLSRSQARGHTRAEDVPRLPIPAFTNPNTPLERALRRVKQGESMRAVAKAEKISNEKFRRFIKEHVEAKREGKQWKIIDHRFVRMAVCSRAQLRWVDFSADQSSAVGHYWIGVNRFLRTNEPSHLQPFKGKGIRDIAGKYFPFETRPNVLRRLDSAGELSFLEI